MKSLDMGFKIIMLNMVKEITPKITSEENWKLNKQQ